MRYVVRAETYEEPHVKYVTTGRVIPIYFTDDIEDATLFNDPEQAQNYAEFVNHCFSLCGNAKVLPVEVNQVK